MTKRTNDLDLHTLLSQSIHCSWTYIYRYIQHYPHEARQRYYRNESPLQLALKAKEKRRRRVGYGLTRSNNEGSGGNEGVDDVH